jgi:hypothetical protein
MKNNLDHRLDLSHNQMNTLALQECDGRYIGYVSDVRASKIESITDG